MPSLCCAHRELEFHKTGMSIVCDTEDDRHVKTNGAIHWIPDTGFVGKDEVRCDLVPAFSQPQ